MDVNHIITAVAAALTKDNLIKYQFEVLGVAFLLLYMLFYWAGSSASRALVRRWNNYLWRPQGVLARNFAVHPGTPDADRHAWKESVTVYRSFASGRRYCQYALVTLDLAAQQDAIMQLWYTIRPRHNQLHVDVLFNEGLMPPTVLMVAASRALGNTLLKQQPGISSYAKPVQVSKERANNWPQQYKDWSIMAEQSSLLYDLLNTEPAIAKALASPWFRSLLISSEDLSGRDDSSEGSAAAAGGEGGSSNGSSGSSSSKGTRQQLRAVFQLPPEQKQEEMDQLLAAVFMLVDLVATYRMSPEVRERAKALRLKLEQEAARKISQSRQGHLAQKRSERLDAERARARAAGPAALAKFEERLQRQMQKREVRKRTMKM